MFRMNKAQREWIIQRREENRQILEYEPQKGAGGLIIENNIISLLIGLHNAGFEAKPEKGNGSQQDAGTNK